MTLYSGLVKMDIFLLDNAIHYRDEHEYKTYTTEFRSEALALIREQGSPHKNRVSTGYCN